VRLVAEAAAPQSVSEPRAWVLLQTSEEDHPARRAVGFWRRYSPDLGQRDEAFETSVMADGRIRRLAGYPLDSPEEIVGALGDMALIKFRRLIVAMPSRERTERFSEVVIAAPSRGGDYRFLGTLAAAAAKETGFLLVPDETDRHEPCILLTGGLAAITLVRTRLLDFDD